MKLKKIARGLFITLLFALAISCKNKSERVYEKGVALMYAGNFSEAKREFSAGLKKHPESGKLAYGVGWVELMEGDVSRALALFGQAIKNEEKFFGGYKGMATLYLMMGNSEKALDFYHQALKRDEKNPSIYSNLGDLYRQEGKFEEAKKSYETAQTLLVGYADIANGFMALALDQNNFDEAIRVGTEALQKPYQQALLKGNAFELVARAYFKKAKDLFAKKDVQAAASQLDAAVALLKKGEQSFGAGRFAPVMQEINEFREAMKNPKKKSTGKSKIEVKSAEKGLGQQIMNQDK